MSDSIILSAVVHNPRAVLAQAVIEVSASVTGTARRYRGQVWGVHAWARPQTAVRVVATPSDRCTIVIAPTGQEVVVRI